MTMEVKTTETVGACDPVRDRVEELRDDMKNGFSDLRSKVQEMDDDELRREMSMLMIIGSAQMEAIRRLRRDVDEMDDNLQRLRFERAECAGAARKLASAMGIPFDPDDSNPAKLIRMAATVAGKYAERHMQPLEMEITKMETSTDKRESLVNVVAVVAFSAFALYVVVLIVLMVSAWVR